MNDSEDTESNERRFRWPAAGDRVLRPGPWILNACMPSKWASNPGYGFVAGYERAATILFEHVYSQQTGQDVLVFPFVFLWRHHIELLLKGVIELGRQLVGEARYPTIHPVDQLWREARRHILRESPEVSADCYAMDGIVADLATIDPDSYEFRYHEDKKGNRTLLHLGDHLNFATFHEAMQKASTFLGCATCVLGEHLDYIRACEAEERANYRDNV